MNWGATIWLNLMEESDIKAVSLNPSILQTRVKKSGMKYIHFPIVDASIPKVTDEQRWQEEISPVVLNCCTK